MRLLRNARHETYATARAMGMTPREAYAEAGYAGPHKNGQLEKRPEVRGRIAEIRNSIVDEAAKKAAVDIAWIDRETRQVYERCIREIPLLGPDRKPLRDPETGEAPEIALESLVRIRAQKRR